MSDYLRIQAIIDAAVTLVDLWRQQKIAGLPRPERNAAIEDVRATLIYAVDHLRGLDRPPRPIRRTDEHTRRTSRSRSSG